MGTPISERHRSRAPEEQRLGPLVAFDFDGTLTVSDTFLAFLRWREGAFYYHLNMAKLAPAAFSYLFHRNPGRLKAAIVRTFLRGLPMKDLEAEALEFATESSRFLLRPDAVKVWRRHRLDGARMLIVTASPEVIIAPFARGLGADLVLGTVLTTDKDGVLTGGLSGPNCRGPEKVKRLRDVFGPQVRLSAAYGDSDGDNEMLAIADHNFMRLFSGDPAKVKSPV